LPIVIGITTDSAVRGGPKGAQNYCINILLTENFTEQLSYGRALR